MPGDVELQPLEIGYAIGGHEDVRRIEQRIAVRALHGDADAHRAGLDGADAGAGHDAHALVREALQRDCREFGIDAGERHAVLDHRNLGAQPAMRLGELERGGPCPDDHQVRQLAGVVEDGLGGEEGGPRRARQWPA